MYDLREFIDTCNELGEVKVLEGADWETEIGAIAQWQVTELQSPLLVFDKIKDYPQGYRICCNMFRTIRREALALGLPLNSASGMDLVRAWREKVRNGVKPIDPVTVKSGPITENVQTGAEIDLYKFPVPKWHAEDGGRYIGTGHCVITRDPEENWVNLGTYRVQVHDKQTATIYMSPGRHAGIIRQKYWDKGVACPAVISIGADPALFAFSCIELPWKASEYGYAGWLRGKAVEVVEGPATGLPIPATAEIVIEGEIVPPGVDARVEGPFGEWTGYYASAARLEAAFRVKTVMHRTNPILMSSPPTLPSKTHYLGVWTRRAADLWDDLDKTLPGIKGAYLLDEPLAGKIAVISIKQMYIGHAKQVALASAGHRSLGYMCKWVIVVDDDIDPSNIREVLWALATRCEPTEDIDFERGCWGSPLDSRLVPEKRQRGQFDHSTAIILACKPYHWINDFPKDIKLTAEKTDALKKKWGKQLSSV